MNPPALITQSLINSLKPESKEYAIKDGQCPGLLIRVQPSGAMSWVLRHKVEGKWRRVTLGSVEDLSIEPPPMKWSAPMIRKSEDHRWLLRDPSPKRLS